MRIAARRYLPKGLFDYIDRGVGEEAGLGNLRSSLDGVAIAPRVLRARSGRSTECSLLGGVQGAPLVIAPTAMAGLVVPQGEIALARAASRHRIPVCLSTQSVTSIGELREKVPDAELWMQLYLWQDSTLSLRLLERARATGVRVLVMTVDTPYGARKEWNIRSGFNMPFRLSPRGVADLSMHPAWLLGMACSSLKRGELPRLGNYPDGLRPGLLGKRPDARVVLKHPLSWEDVAWVRRMWPGLLVLKGILTVEDARQAASAGADGIVVSSHGARNFDAAPAPINVLADIAAAVDGQLTVMADSGIRRGLDVLRYRYRGAVAVMLGRLPLWALAAGGEAGVDAALAVLKQEYVEALDFSGLSEKDMGAASASQRGSKPGQC